MFQPLTAAAAINPYLIAATTDQHRAHQLALNSATAVLIPQAAGPHGAPGSACIPHPGLDPVQVAGCPDSLLAAAAQAAAAAVTAQHHQHRQLLMDYSSRLQQQQQQQHHHHSNPPVAHPPLSPVRGPAVRNKNCLYKKKVLISYRIFIVGDNLIKVSKCSFSVHDNCIVIF